ncbi:MULTISPECIES: metal-dependent hydrolase [Haloprofundus]|uniref:metal-dependent hydrolase n=1 Tax=Haloprofundus TaxID=1911573 RepID=UPI000E44E731|nr:MULTISPECIES: metal-dependent hydrolase [Haloprofundus]QCJ47979.1 metal-dependent hydrolase [Haloprofundus sp. MHR1]
MVDVSGHIGIALLALSPAWFLVDRESAVAFIALGTPFGMLPDIDLYLSKAVATVQHHGVTHTLLFVGIVSAVLGPLLGRTLVPWLADRGSLSRAADALDRPSTFAGLAVFVGGAAHVFGDILSAPDISQPIEPLWPLVPGSVGIDVVYYNSNPVNFGLLAAGVLVNVGFWWWRK